MEKQKIINPPRDLRLLYDLLSVDFDNINSMSHEELNSIIQSRFNFELTERQLYQLKDSTLNEDIRDVELYYKNII